MSMMVRNTHRTLRLTLPMEEAFLRLAPAFVSQGAVGLGLDAEAAEEMALAAEEVMAYLVRLGGGTGTEVDIRCLAGSHYIQTDISFPVDAANLRAFNMTATVSLDDQSGLDEMGLLIASRLADRFRISHRPDGKPELSLIKEFSYPEILVDHFEECHPLASFSLIEPDPGQLKWFLGLVQQICPATTYPWDFLYPGKIIDMAAAGEYRLRLAVSPTGEIGGGIVWRWEGLKTVEMFGPYIFHPQTTAAMARGLMDACIVNVARSSAQVLINRMPPAALPAGYLEPLGTISMSVADGAPQRLSWYFRELHEDMGAVSWVHPDLHDYLAAEYRRLVFPREIRPVAASGEAGQPFSVLSAEMDRRLGRVELRPIWPGADRRENLQNHLAMIGQAGLAHVFFAMDLGLSWQCEFTPDLLALGFTPRLVLPHAGCGDLLLFELFLQTA